MERLTRYFYENCAGVDCEKCGRRKTGKCNTSADCAQTIADRLAAIEDILGVDYDLDRLHELMEADRDGRCVVLPIKLPGFGWCCNDKFPDAISAYFDRPSQVVDCMEDYILRETKEAAEAALKGDGS